MHSIWRSILIALPVLWLIVGMGFARGDHVVSSSGIGVLISPGDDAEAIAYYQRISGKLGVTDTRTNLSSLTALLSHLGVKLTAEQFEAATPTDLMTAFPKDSVLASRFFAPKIVNFNSPTGDPKYPFQLGWRKLARVVAIPGSDADKAGLAAAYILFNYVQKTITDDPFPDGSFKTESFNTQAIIVPKSFKKGEEDSAFFLDYASKTEGYKISLALNAAFDTAELNPGGLPKRDYFVPTSCAQCHGHDQEDGAAFKGKFPFVKINYLDSDQWYDLAATDDFPSIKNGVNDVLFDGGKDHTSQQYKNAVDVIRKLNTLIRQQNIDSARANGSDLFKVKAVEKWLSVHQTNDNPVAPIDRALDLGKGIVWKNTGDEPKLLGLLDRYCFRCHSSVLYNVFDKESVLLLKPKIFVRVQLPKENKNHMPQGRVLDDPTIAEFVTFIQNLN